MTQEDEAPSRSVEDVVGPQLLAQRQNSLRRNKMQFKWSLWMAKRAIAGNG